MSNKKILTGNEAVARGFFEGGGIIASSYPGSPTVQILDSLKEYDEIFSQWGTNEKVAMEIAIGGSIAGAASMVSMKHVGLNIAADPFMTFTQVKTKGALLLIVGDDPGLTSSQNEQDSRFFGKFANIPIFDPCNPQEAKDFVIEGIKISETFNTPVLIRLTSRLCHCRGIVELNERSAIPSYLGFEEDQSRYCMLPPHANIAQQFMKERIENLKIYNSTYYVNNLETNNSDTLIITSGMCYENLKELDVKVDILKLGMIFPLPMDLIKELYFKYKKVIVIEEMLPFIENELKIEGLHVLGKELFSFTGELTIEVIKQGLIKGNVMQGELQTKSEKRTTPFPPRTPMLCAGCPHRPIFHILKMNKATVIGDIGCYSLGILEPFEVHKTNISMGASLGMVLGLAEAESKINKNRPLVATIGDGTFFHSGITGFLQLAKTDKNITVIVMDNRTTAMTGGQITPTTGDYFKEENLYSVNIADILKSIGIKDITVVDQFKYKETKEAINNAMKRNGLSIIITTRPCALNFKIKTPHYYVDETICISCRSCIKTNCPPISMKLYEGKTKKNSYIDSDMCVGCSVCSQVCPVGAIKCSNTKEGEV